MEAIIGVLGGLVGVIITILAIVVVRKQRATIEVLKERQRQSADRIYGLESKLAQTKLQEKLNTSNKPTSIKTSSVPIVDVVKSRVPKRKIHSKPVGGVRSNSSRRYSRLENPYTSDNRDLGYHSFPSSSESTPAPASSHSFGGGGDFSGGGSGGSWSSDSGSSSGDSGSSGGDGGGGGGD